jgi:predicted amidohydrolase YtcJ
LIFGSDAPIENPDPLEGLGAAVHRSNWENRSQTISAMEALASYTIHPAAASGESKERGSLEAGKLADFVLFSEDPIKAEFKDCKVVGTVIDGKFVYQEFE